MLGRDHALLGGVAYLAVAPAIFHDPTWPVLGVGCVTSAAFALLPDIDEPGSTVSRKLGPISRAVSEVTNKVAGGHRQATHSLFFAGLVGLGAWWVAQHRIALTVLVAASFLLVFRMLVPAMLRWSGVARIGMLAGAAGAGYWVYHDYAAATATHSGIAGLASVGWVVLACAGGVIWHMVGDSLTVEGVPWLWLPGVHPLQRIRIAIPLVGHCGSARETLVGVVMSVALIWMAVVMVAEPAFATIHFGGIHLPSLPHVPGIPSAPHVTVPSTPHIG